MSIYRFPAGFPEPNLSSSGNTGDSFRHELTDSTISTTSDANYKHTRPRTTRMINKWTFAWNGVTQAAYDVLVAFFKQVGTFQQFEWVNPLDGVTYVVRFEGHLKWQENFPYGWEGSLVFEEV